MIVGHECRALRDRLPWSLCLAALMVLGSAGAAHADAPRRAEQSADKQDGKKKSDSKATQKKKGEREGDEKESADKTDKRPADKVSKKKAGRAGKNKGRKTGKKKTGTGGKKPADKAGKKPKVVIDAELQEKIDELLEREGIEDPRKAGKPSPRPRGQEPSAEGSGASAPINIPAIEDPDNDIPPEEREYEFSFKDVTYEQLIEGVARQTGLGVIGVAPKDGKVSFITTEKLNFEQLMDRVRTLLFNYKQLEPFTIVRNKTHLQVIKVNDYLRHGMPQDHMFRSVESFQSASLADSELALVVYTPKSGSVAALRELRNYLPDYVRIAPLEGQNRVTIFALVRDIRKYLDLIEFFPNDSDDPRTIEKIKIHNILPSEAITKLGALMELDGGTARPRPSGRKVKSRSVSPLDVIREPDVTLIPEDAQGVFIVRAMQDKIAEIKMLLPFIDVDTASPFVPVTIDLDYADPEDLITIIQQILAVSEGSSPGASPRKPSRGKKRASKASTPVTADEITLLPHPAGNAIIVLADDEGVARVRALIEKFDEPFRLGPIELPLDHADAGDVADAIAQVFTTAGAPKGVKRSSSGFVLVPDPSGDALWFTGSEKDLAKVLELVRVFDTAEDAVSLHTVELVFRKPSFVMDMLRQFDIGAGGGRAAAKPKGGKRRKKATPAVSKFTAVDEEMRLYVFCTDKEWDRYLSLIRQLDDDAEEHELFHRLALTHIEPSEALVHLTQLPVSHGGSVQYVETQDSLLIFGATPQQLADIETLLVEIDVASDMEERTFEILHADPAELVTLIETLVGDPRTPQKPRGKRSAGKGKKGAARATVFSETLSIVQIDRSLVVRAIPAKMEKVAELIDRYDVPDDTPLVRIKLTHIESARAVEWLQDVMGEPRGSGDGGLRFLPEAGDLVVLDASDFQIEEVRRALAEIDRPSELVQRTFMIEHADPGELVTLIESLVSTQAGPSSPSRPKSKGKGGRRVPKTVKADDLHIVQIDRRLVVRTTPTKMQRVAEVIEEFDVEGDRPSEMRVYQDFPRGTDIDSMALTLSSAFSGSSSTGGKPKKGAAGDAKGPLFIPEPAIGKLVVYAEPAMFEKIEELLEVLLVDVEMPELEFDSIALEFADPQDLVEQVEPFLSIKVQRLIAAGQLPATPPEGETETKLIKGKGGRKSSRSGASRPWFHLDADTRNGRIVIAAPRVVIDEAMTLIADFDKPGEDPIFRTVDVHNADVAEMVAAIKEMMGSASSKKAGAPAPKGGRAPRVSPRTSLVVTTAPGGGAIVLHGTPDDVEQATVWIKQLDEEAVAGRLIKVYDIANADMESLVNLIMNVVDTVPASPRGKKASRRPKAPELPADEDEFSTKITRVGIEVYIQADLISNTMLVAASPAKLARVDEIVAQFNEPSDEGSPLVSQPMARRVFDLKYADAFDAVFELEMVLEALWEPADLLPRVEEAFFGSALIVRYPHEDRFAEIEGFIAKYVDKREDTGPPRRKTFAPPPGITAKDAALWLMTQHPELNIKITNMTPGKADEDYGIEQLKPVKSAGANPCVLPAAFYHSIDALLATVTAMNDEKDDPDEKAPKAKAEADEREKDELSGVDALLSEKAASFLDKTQDRPVERVGLEGLAPGESEQIEIYYNEKENVFVIKGYEDVLGNLEDSLDDLKEEIERVGGAPDIRIYRVKYIDIDTAKDIIEEMYNTPKQQQAQIRQMQQIRMQQQRQQQQQQRRQQQQQQQGRGKEGADGKQVQQPPGAKGGQQMNIPQIPAAAVRVYPNPRDRTLILRAETSQYPAILELLATIDRPRPVESTHRIFKLDKLNAAEVETLLKSLLGLEQPRGQRRASARGRGQQATTSPGGQLPSQIMQETDTASGPLSVDPKDIKISSNADANTIIVMAPPVALDYIEELIKDLESEQIPERIPQHYELQHADVQEVSDYLTTHFEEPGATPRRRPGQKGRQPRTGPRALNAPVFIAYERLNLLSAQATAEQIEEIDGLIKRLDVKSEADEWVTVTLNHADAGVVADTLSAMFAGGTSAPRRGGRARGKTPAGSGPKFIGEEGAKVLFFSAPAKLHERIHTVVAQLEEQSRVVTTPRIITLEYATPTSVAEAIESAYGGAGSGRRGGGRRSRGTASTARFTIAADDPSKRLFVVADDQLFGEIESLAQSLDQPRNIGFDFKIYPLAHASARKIHEMLGNLVRDFTRSAGPKAAREPFAVEVDEKANALIVLGGPVVFDFVEKALKTVDIPANAESPPGYLMVALKNANAQELAQSINRIWSQRNLPEGETPPQAEASRTLNMLYVRGTQEQVDQIKKEFIDPLEEHAPPKLLTETITLEHAQPEAVAESINQFFQAKADASRRLGREGNVSPLEFTVVVMPEVDTKQLIVQASVENLEFIKTRVSELDRPEVGLASATSMKIYPIKYADPNAVVTIIREWSRSRTQGAGGRGRKVASRDVVVAVAEHATQSVVVTASTSNHVIIQELIDGLDNEELATTQRKRQVIRLEHANSDDIAGQLGQVFRQTRGRRRGDQGPTFVSDPKTNSIIANVNDEELTEVSGLLLAIDIEPPFDTERTMKVHKIKYADPNGIVNAINSAFRWYRGSRLRPEDQVVAVVDWGTQSVIVTASQENHEKIEKLISELDDEKMATGHRKQHVLSLKHANAGEVSSQLSQVFGRRRRIRGDTGPAFIPAPKTNSIVASMNDEEFAQVTELLEKIDVESGAETDRLTVPYPLKYADPGSINGVILNRFRWDRRAQPSPAEQVTSAIDWGTRSVIVTASPKNHEIIAKMIEEVDVESTIKKELYVHKLTKASADDVARALQSAYRGRRRTGRGETPVQITAEAQTNALIISANATEMEELTELIESIDVAPEAGRQRQVRSFSLTYANPWNVRDAINSLYRGLSRNPRDQVTAVPESGSNSVIVSASPENMERVEELITQLDSADTNQREVHVINIEHADPSGVARALNDIYVRSAQRSRGGEQPISISEIQGSKAVLVKASATDMARIMKTVTELDVDAFEAGESVRVVQLVRSDATEMQTAVQNMLAKRGGGGRRRGGGELIGDMRVSVLTQANALVISGDLEEVERLEATVLAMDAEAGEGTQAQLIRLTYAVPGQLLPILQEMYVNQGGGRRRGRGQVQPVITANEALKALVVRASPMDFADIKATVVQLDVVDAAQPETFRIIPVPQGRDLVQWAADLERGLNDSAVAQYAQSGGSRGGGRRRGSAVPSVTITADPRARNLFVTGSPSMFDEVEKAVAAMATTGPVGPTMMKVIRPINLSVEDIQRILQQMKGEGAGSGSRARRGSSGSGRRGAGRSSRPGGRRPSGRSSRGRSRGR